MEFWERKLIAADFLAGNHWAAVNRLSLLQGTTSGTNRRPPPEASGPTSIGALAGLRPGLQLPARRKWAFGANQRLPERPNATPVRSTIGNPCIPCSSSVTVGVGGCVGTQGRSRPLFFFPAALQRAVLRSCYQQLTLPPRRHEDCILCSGFCTDTEYFLCFCTGTTYQYSFCS